MSEKNLNYKDSGVDIEAANEVAKKLKEDKFYWLCSQTAEKRFDDYYTERAWLENWEKTNG